jgi:hypothetical protein
MRRSQVRFLSAPPFNTPAKPQPQSKDAGYDIGMERAIRAWLQRNYLVWAPDDVEDEEPADAAPPTPPA